MSWAPPPCSLVTLTELHKWLQVSHLGGVSPFVAPNRTCFVLQVRAAGVWSGPGWRRGREPAGHPAASGRGDRTAGGRGRAVQCRPGLPGHPRWEPPEPQHPDQRLHQQGVPAACAVPPSPWVAPCRDAEPPSAWGRVLCSDPAFCPPAGRASLCAQPSALAGL